MSLHNLKINTLGFKCVLNATAAQDLIIYLKKQLFLKNNSQHKKIEMISAYEKELNCNTLIGIVRACEGKRVQIDLRNELHVYGKVESVFGDMNVMMSKARVMTPAFKIYDDEGAESAKAKSKLYEELTIRGRNIRFVHVPDDIDMVKALQRQILAVTRPNLKKMDQKQFKKRPRNPNNFNNQNKSIEN